MNKAFLEIGFEEIPADYLKPAVKNIKENTGKLLTAARIGFERIEVFYTVRRFVLLIEGIADKQEDLSYEKKGPKEDIAYKDGVLTEIGKKFIAGAGLKEEEIKIKEEKGRKFLSAAISEKGKKTQDVLGGIFEDVIRGIKFPKTMVWDSTLADFARPVRWLISFYNNEEIKIKYANVDSGSETRLHKFDDENRPAAVKNGDDYFKTMENSGIELPQEKRKALILEKSSRALKEKGLKIIEDRALLERLASSVEKITVNAGEFDEKYLFLPVEVIITAMREHQRYFAVSGKNGEFTNYFVNIRDGGNENSEAVTKAHASVLYARLNDAEFFYKEDLKTPLEENLPKLKEAIFITGLGSMHEKIQRLEVLAEKADELFGCGDTQALREAARLCKADLVTDMISEKEFASLRGFMGGIYLEKQGKDKKITDAVSGHYFPHSAGDVLPETNEAALLSLIDKMDNMCGFFLAGFKPTGSKDPYAVRRQALNIIYMIMEKKIKVDMRDFIQAAADIYEKQFGKKLKDGELMRFIKQREENYFRDKGFDYDIINSVIKQEGPDILDDFAKISILADARKTQDFNGIVFALSRVENIVPEGFNSGAVNKDLFEHDEEKELYAKFEKKKSEIKELMEKKAFERVFEIISGFKPEIDDFFDRVLVMCGDEKIKNNRLSMLVELNEVFRSFAEFSEIVINRK
ncbi:MAG: glycine--tRNA ligase subunit beta [Candidatus Goldiibacteriota bacterium]